MTGIINLLKNHIVQKKHNAHLGTLGDNLARGFARRNLPGAERMVERLKPVHAAVQTVMFPEESILCNRTMQTLPYIFTPGEILELLVGAEVRSNRLHHVRFTL